MGLKNESKNFSATSLETKIWKQKKLELADEYFQKIIDSDTMPKERNENISGLITSLSNANYSFATVGYATELAKRKIYPKKDFIKRVEESCLEQPRDLANETKSYNPNHIAMTISNEHRLLFSAGRFYRYEGGVFRPCSDGAIRVLIKEQLGDSNTIRANEEVYKALSIDTYQEPESLNLYGKNLVNLLNGMLDVERMELLPHNPTYLSTVQLSVSYNPTATCPVFSETVIDWLENKEKVELLEEFLGNCLSQEPKQEKMLFLIGSGANGKSTLLYVVEAMFGKENCSAIPLETLASRFDLAQLLDKVINITSETPSKSVLCDDVIKSVVTGDLIRGEKKFQAPFFFRPHAKFIVACNEMPRTEDKTDALYRRLLILRFNRTYTEAEQDKTLKTKLVAEKDGILNVAITGLKRLRERGYFKEPSESIAEREAYRKENNTLMSFVEDECAICDQGISQKDELYQRYKTWCDDSGLRKLSKQRFGKGLKEHYKIGEDFEGSAYDRHRVWTGIVLKR